MVVWESKWPSGARSGRLDLQMGGWSSKSASGGPNGPLELHMVVWGSKCHLELRMAVWTSKWPSGVQIAVWSSKCPSGAPNGRLAFQMHVWKWPSGAPNGRLELEIVVWKVTWVTWGIQMAVNQSKLTPNSMCWPSPGPIPCQSSGPESLWYHNWTRPP